MICPRCGREIPDGAVCPCSGGEQLLSSNPALNVLKKLGSSPLFLTAVILYSVTIVLSIFALISAPASFDYVYDMLENSGMDYTTLYPMISVSTSGSVAGAIVASIPQVLICIGMWLFYVTCRDRRTGNISTAGLTMCKVMLIIALVIGCIMAALVAILAVVVGAAGGLAYSYYDSDLGGSIAVILGICMVVIVAVLALIIAFYASAVRTVNRVKNCAVTGIPEYRISGFLTAMLWIGGILSCITGFGMMFASFLSGLGELSGGVCSILIALCLGRLRQQMTALAYPPVQPVYVQPVPPVQSAYSQQAPVQPAAPAQTVYPPEPAAPAQPAAPAVQPSEVPQEEEPKE